MGLSKEEKAIIIKFYGVVLCLMLSILISQVFLIIPTALVLSSIFKEADERGVVSDTFIGCCIGTILGILTVYPLGIYLCAILGASYALTNAKAHK